MLPDREMDNEQFIYAVSNWVDCQRNFLLALQEAFPSLPEAPDLDEFHDVFLLAMANGFAHEAERAFIGISDTHDKFMQSISRYMPPRS